MPYEIKLQVGSPHMLRDHLCAAISNYGDGSNIKHTLQDALAQIDEQMKPAVEEPLEFGSVVRAPWSDKNLLWVKAAHNSWWSESGIATAWSELRNPEVLRVGIGEPRPNAELGTLLDDLRYLVQAWESIPAQRVHDLITAFEIDAAADADA